MSSYISTTTWKLFSAVVTQRQQWFAVYLVTGKTPREMLKDKDKDRATRSRPVIQAALSKLSQIESMEAIEALAMLEFIALAANLWEPVMLELRRDKESRDAFLRFLAELKPFNFHQREARSSTSALQFQIAAYIVNILGLLSHHSNEFKDTTTLRHITPRLGYLIDHGVSTPSYNTSLHHNLKENFESRFQGFSVHKFKRTPLSNPSLGPDFYYDTQLAAKVLSFNSAWAGKSNQGYAEEFARANLNLSFVEAQVVSVCTIS